jgi:hypothetical protein
METITNILAVIPDWIEAIALVVTAASAIAALTPTKKDDDAIAKVLAFIRKVANLFALNVANAKPKDDSKD